MSIGFVLPIISLGLGAIMLKPKRGFFPSDQEPIIAQATIEEIHKDELEITNHPVEQGAPITDHAYKMPEEVIIHCAWSNSASNNPNGLVGSAVAALGDQSGNLFTATSTTITAAQSLLSGNSASQVRDIYDKLRDLQESRIPFDIFTGKRHYTNMLFKSLSVTTDAKSENSLMVTAVCKQVILVSTQTVNVPININAQANPKLTSPVQNSGQQNLKPANNFQDPLGT